MKISEVLEKLSKIYQTLNEEAFGTIKEENKRIYKKNGKAHNYEKEAKDYIASLEPKIKEIIEKGTVIDLRKYFNEISIAQMALDAKVERIIREKGKNVRVNIEKIQSYLEREAEELLKEESFENLLLKENSNETDEESLEGIIRKHFEETGAKNLEENGEQDLESSKEEENKNLEEIKEKLIKALKDTKKNIKKVSKKGITYESTVLFQSNDGYPSEYYELLNVSNDLAVNIMLPLAETMQNLQKDYGDEIFDEIEFEKITEEVIPESIWDDYEDVIYSHMEFMNYELEMEEGFVPLNHYNVAEEFSKEELQSIIRDFKREENEEIYEEIFEEFDNKLKHLFTKNVILNVFQRKKSKKNAASDKESFAKRIKNKIAEVGKTKEVPERKTETPGKESFAKRIKNKIAEIGKTKEVPERKTETPEKESFAKRIKNKIAEVGKTKEVPERKAETQEKESFAKWIKNKITEVGKIKEEIKRKIETPEKVFNKALLKHYDTCKKLAKKPYGNWSGRDLAKAYNRMIDVEERLETIKNYEPETQSNEDQTGIKEPTKKEVLNSSIHNMEKTTEDLFYDAEGFVDVPKYMDYLKEEQKANKEETFQKLQEQASSFVEYVKVKKLAVKRTIWRALIGVAALLSVNGAVFSSSNLVKNPVKQGNVIELDEEDQDLENKSQEEKIKIEIEDQEEVDKETEKNENIEIETEEQIEETIKEDEAESLDTIDFGETEVKLSEDAKVYGRMSDMANKEQAKPRHHNQITRRIYKVVVEEEGTLKTVDNAEDYQESLNNGGQVMGYLIINDNSYDEKGNVVYFEGYYSEEDVHKVEGPTLTRKK